MTKSSVTRTTTSTRLKSFDPFGGVRQFSEDNNSVRRRCLRGHHLVFEIEVMVIADVLVSKYERAAESIDDFPEQTGMGELMQVYCKRSPEIPATPAQMTHRDAGSSAVRRADLSPTNIIGRPKRHSLAGRTKADIARRLFDHLGRSLCVYCMSRSYQRYMSRERF